MIYIKRIVNADITRQIDLTKEPAEEFFKFSENSINISFKDEKSGRQVNGIVKKTGHTPTITGDIFSLVKYECKLNDLIIFKKNKGNYSFLIVKTSDTNYKSYNDTLNTFGSQNGGISTHLVSIMSIVSEKVNSYLPYITAIKTKPFLLLAGISGTGKSRIVRQLAKSCWDPSTDDGKKQRDEHKPRNYELIQVKPNWHDSSELMGFESRLDGGRFIVGPFLKFIVKAMQDPKKPYFLCLDEMNLAPVEQYFAEYLSVLETRKLKDGKIITDPIIEASIFNKKYAENYNIFEELGLKKINRTVPQEALINNTPEISFDEYDRQDIVDIIKEEGLRIPQNLIVVGTVNMDETTYGFSRKVLDRAMTIEMNEVDLKAGLDEESMEMPYIKEECFIPDCVEGKDVYSDYTTECNDALEYLELINKELDNSPFKIAYRTRNEFLVYIVNALRLVPNTEDKNYVIAKALDEITCMKILSRIEGDKRRVGDRISKDHLQKVVNDMKTQFTEKIEKEEKRKQLEEYQLISVAKLEHMQDKLNSGYTDFWD